MYNPFIEKKIFKSFLTNCHNHNGYGHGRFGHYNTLITYLCRTCSTLTISRCKYTNTSDESANGDKIGSITDSACWEKDGNENDHCSNVEIGDKGIATLTGKNTGILYFQYDKHNSSILKPCNAVTNIAELPEQSSSASSAYTSSMLVPCLLDTKGTLGAVSSSTTSI